MKKIPKLTLVPALDGGIQQLVDHIHKLEELMEEYQKAIATLEDDVEFLKELTTMPLDDEEIDDRLDELEGLFE